MKTDDSILKGYRYIFGPVSSRRLGMSLGVDLMPHKTCTLNCVYCECGKTTHLVKTRKEYVPTKDVIGELKDYLEKTPELDYITFSGSGEPTLHSGIGDVIRFLKSGYSQYKIALLTNGTLFYLPEVRKAVMDADLIIASVDAGTEETFQKVNRPHPGLKFDRMSEGLVQLGKERKNQLWMEFFIVPGINDNTYELSETKKLIERIQADKTQLNILDRPGTESWVMAADEQTQKRIKDYFGHSETISKTKPVQGRQADEGELDKSILATIRRRPSTLEDLSQTLGVHQKKVWQHICMLLDHGIVEKNSMPRGEFFIIKKD
ncbi:MAG: radical SAM protein [Proteobacteria bacterium]|nr:radical SAM protein [Pseudomonadota bacterium]